MNTQARVAALLACLLALSGVVVAALGSHLVDLEAVDHGARIWQTAATLHLFAAAAILGLSAWLHIAPSKRLLWACWGLLLGTAIFCFSLYLRVITGGNYTGAAPVGGFIMMLSWLLACWSFASRFASSSTSTLGKNHE